jgi:hypothetical protein
MHLRNIAALTLLLAIGSAMADDGINGLQSKEEFAATKARIMKDIDGDKKYREMSPEDQKTLLATLSRMDQRWERVDAGGQLSPNDRVDMANDQEIVLTITQHASADSRMVCERVEAQESHRVTNVCKTVAQLRRDQDNAQNEMRDAQKSH